MLFGPTLTASGLGGAAKPTDFFRADPDLADGSTSTHITLVSAFLSTDTSILRNPARTASSSVCGIYPSSKGFYSTSSGPHFHNFAHRAVPICISSHRHRRILSGEL